MKRDRHSYPILPEVYLDESYMNQNHVASRSWLDAGRKRYAKEGKGNRYCISQLKTKEDYHGHFNSEIFEKWFKVLCVTLKESYGSCIFHLTGPSTTSEPVQYATVAIARVFGHQVLFTPPYYPELQPIEIIWA
ncbi:hypothetical protein ACHHYP_15120 [Achlya hypogyna]|uniref:Tc1-like transposase DDE domain-containing protein n=1 Tax=Achlya hypogyna TaxID=1202772 RepID=A0A1V9YBK4_ACHHY|nr:hypothetical protein ACHHYP_15120 [Achlya hypogyna]